MGAVLIPSDSILAYKAKEAEGNLQLCLSKDWNTVLFIYTVLERCSGIPHLDCDDLQALRSADAELQVKQGTLSQDIAGTGSGMVC